MDYIRQAVEHAKASQGASLQPHEQPDSALHLPPLQPTAGTARVGVPEVALDGVHLESKRIVSHDIADPRSKSFDILRTQVLQSMNLKSWKIVGVTSPTAGCGKTTVSTNLALSIARQPEKPVLLVDMDLQNPQVAKTLGLKCDQGLLSVLEGRTKLSSVFVKASINDDHLLVLPCEASTLRSSEWMTSRAMTGIIHELKRSFGGWTVIFDLPPILTSDEVISILPQIDCVLFVSAAGISTTNDIKECNKHLESTPIVRVVLNRSSDTPAAYYSRYAEPAASRR